MRPAVLVVESDVLVRDLVYNVLSENYEVLTARNGHEAMRIFELHRKHVAAVLTDLQMRCGDGDKFVEWLYQQDEQVPIIVMTGSVEEETEISCSSTM